MISLDNLFRTEAVYDALAQDVRATLDAVIANVPKKVRCGKEVFFALTIKSGDYLGCDFVYDPDLPECAFIVDIGET